MWRKATHYNPEFIEQAIGKCWGVILAKSYRYIACMYEYVTINHVIMNNSKAPIKKVEKKRKQAIISRRASSALAVLLTLKHT